MTPSKYNRLNTRATEVSDIDVATTYDLGTVNKGKVAVANLPVRNLGNAPLKVEGISTSCGCTTAKLSLMTIPLSGQANLHVEYDSNAHSSDLGRWKGMFLSPTMTPKTATYR